MWKSKAALWANGFDDDDYLAEHQYAFLNEADGGVAMDLAYIEFSRFKGRYELEVDHDLRHLWGSDHLPRSDSQSRGVGSLLFLCVRERFEPFPVSLPALRATAHVYGIAPHYLSKVAKAWVLTQSPPPLCIPQEDRYFSPKGLYYNLYTCGIKAEEKSLPSIGQLVIYKKGSLGPPQQTYMVASTQKLELLSILSHCLANFNYDKNSTFHLGLFLCQVSCLHWDSALDNLEAEAAKIRSKLMAASNIDHVMVMSITTLGKTIDDVSDYLDRNTRIVSWLKEDIFKDESRRYHSPSLDTDSLEEPNNKLGSSTIQAAHEGIQQVMEEYLYLVARAADIHAKWQKIQDMVLVLLSVSSNSLGASSLSQAEVQEWTLLQMLKVTFVMTNSVKSMGVVLIAFMPGIFLSTLFSTEFFYFDQSGGIRVSSNFGIYWAVMAPLTFVFVVYQWLWPRFLSGNLPKFGNNKKASPDLATVTTDMSMKEQNLLSKGKGHSEATRATGLFRSDAHESDRQKEIV